MVDKELINELVDFIKAVPDVPDWLQPYVDEHGDVTKAAAADDDVAAVMKWLSEGMTWFEECTSEPVIMLAVLIEFKDRQTKSDIDKVTHLFKIKED